MLSFCTDLANYVASSVFRISRQLVERFGHGVGGWVGGETAGVLILSSYPPPPLKFTRDPNFGDDGTG